MKQFVTIYGQWWIKVLVALKQILKDGPKTGHL